MDQLQAVFNRIKVVAFSVFSSLLAQSQSNYAVSLDGVDDYVSLPTNVAVSQSNTFTIEAWVYWNGTGNGCIYSETVQGNNNPMLSISPRSADGGGIELVFRDNSATGLVLQPAAAAVTANTWVHVAVVRTSATNIKTYINGILKDDATFTAPASWTPTKVNAGIRWRVSQDGPFAGKVDELRIWNTARTQAEIKANMFNKNLSNGASGLVAYYKMNDGSGTTATNSCTNTASIDGTLTNGPTWSSSPIQYSGNALSFDGVDDYVVSTTTSNLNMNNSSFTVEAWINSGNSSANTSTERILMQWGPTWQAGSYQLVCTNSYINFNFNGSSTGSCTYNVNWQDANWHHVAGVFDISTHTLYLYYDGVQKAAVSTAGHAPGSLNSSLYIGGSPGVAGSFTSATIDELRIWNVARTQAQIQNGMNSELDPTLQTGLVSYYTIDQGIAGGNNAGMTTLIDQAATNNGTLTNFALSGASSNFLTQNNGMFVLPLNWLSFTAQKRNGNVLLQWTTSSEINTSNFAIERSSNGKDWRAIGTLLSKNYSGLDNYVYTDDWPANGVNYYRIRQNDKDGKSSYSRIEVVNFDQETKPFKLIANPVINNTLQIRIYAPSNQPLTFTSIDGKILWKKQLSGGLHTINENGLTRGVYILKSGTYAEKLLIQ